MEVLITISEHKFMNKFGCISVYDCFEKLINEYMNPVFI